MDEISIRITRLDIKRWEWRVYRRDMMLAGGTTTTRLLAYLRAVMWIQDFAVTEVVD